MKKLNKGFTLLELLVVVLIIGILAGIALPQYQMAVGKAKYAEIKASTLGISEALRHYYLIHDTYQDVTVDNLDIELPKTVSCTLWTSQDNRMKCCKSIFGKSMCFYRSIEGTPQLCLTFSTDKTDKSNRLCQIETGRKNGSCGSNYCQYLY